MGEYGHLAGKTASCLWFLDLLFHHKKIKKVLVIAPLSTLHAVWSKEIQAVCPYIKYTVMHGTRAQRLEALASDAKIVITNTDAPRTYELELMKANFDVIIIDEITDFASVSSLRSKALQKICARARSVYGLSGNPTAGGLMASFGIGKVVNPGMLPTKYFTKYRSLIMNQVTMYEYTPREGAIEIVNKALQPAIKFSLEECVDLPEIVYEERYIPLPKETEDLFKTMLNHQIAEYKRGLITAQTAGVKMIRLVQILTGFCKTDDGEYIDTDVLPKLQALEEIYHEAGCKLVVFVQSVRVVDQIKEYLNSKKIKTELIYGDISLKERTKLIDEFQNGGPSVLVAQVRTMSHGITLTASHTVVFFGIVMGNGSYQQAVHRIRRIGQTKRQVVIKLISSKFEKLFFEKMAEIELTSQDMLSLYDNLGE